MNFLLVEINSASTVANLDLLYVINLFLDLLLPIVA
jgi:hypothetical protein